MKLREKYKNHIVMDELKEVVMYTMFETAVRYGLSIPTMHDVEIMFNKAVSLDNPWADKLKPVNHITPN